MSAEGQPSPPDSDAEGRQDWFGVIAPIFRIVEFHVGVIEQKLTADNAPNSRNQPNTNEILHHLGEIRTSIADGLDYFREDIGDLGLSADVISQMESDAEETARKVISLSASNAEMRGIGGGEPASASGLDAERLPGDGRETDHTSPNANDTTPQRQRRAGAAAAQRDSRDFSPGDEADTTNTARNANAAMPERRLTRSMAKSDSGDDTGGTRGEMDHNNDTSENAENQDTNEGGDAGTTKNGGKKSKRKKGKRKKRKKKNTQHSLGGSCADGESRGEIAGDKEGTPSGEEQWENDEVEDPEARFTLEDFNTVAEKYHSSSESIAVATTYLNGNIARLIDAIFDGQHLEGIPALARNYALVLSTLRKYGDVEAQRLVLQAQRDLVDAEENARDILADSFPALSASSTLGSFLSAMPDDDDDNEEEREETDESGEENGDNEVSALAEATEKIAVLMRAIGVHDSNAAGSEDGREGHVTKERVKNILTVGRHTRRIAKHLFHIFLQHEVYYILTVYDILSHFSQRKKKDMAKMIRDVEALAKAVEPRFDFNKQTTASEYIEKVILRALASENHHTRTAAVEVIGHLYTCTTDTRSELRQEIICEGGYRKAELKRLDGGTSDTGVRYCSERNDLRKKVCTTYWLFLIKTIVERLESVRIHFPYGYTESILLLSPSLIGKECTFMLSKTIVAVCKGDDADDTIAADCDSDEDGSDSDGKLKALTEAMKKRRKEHFDGGKRIVIIDCDEQLESLRQLAISD